MSSIGYQGSFGSNSYLAAMQLAERQQWDDCQLLPLVSSQNVVAALQAGEVDFGVLAVHNNVAGEVLETTAALKGISYEVLDRTELLIRHCIFAKDANTTIEVVASHVQALMQCQKTIKTLFPNAVLKELEDTAIGAVYLADGTLPDSTAVICPQPAGDHFHLTLLKQDAQDTVGNATQFILLKRS